jgi:predicted transport protein
MKLEFSQQIFLKLSICMKFNENPSSELFHADGRTDGRRGMKKLKVAFRNFTKAPKNAGL